MTRDLEAEIGRWLEEHGPATAERIAAGVRARRADVDAALRGAFRYGAPAPEGSNPRATYWHPAPVASRAVPHSDADYLAAVLADGEWHSLDQIIARSQRERGFGLTVHSRAADLRRRGLVVENQTERGLNGRVISSYRIVSLEKTESQDAASSVAAFRGLGSVSSSEAPAVGHPAGSSSAANPGELERADASSTPSLFDDLEDAA